MQIKQSHLKRYLGCFVTILSKISNDVESFGYVSKQTQSEVIEILCNIYCGIRDTA